jgi:regulator of protease activity HflC (stomatin/prohibitin superfamily)
MTFPVNRIVKAAQDLERAAISQQLAKETRIMRRRFNPVQSFIRNFVRLVVFVPLFWAFALPDFRTLWVTAERTAGASVPGLLALGIAKTLLFLWIANVLARIFYVLPEWERLVLLRMGKSVGARGPGVFFVPPFLYSVARVIDIRISTYEVKATKTLTKDNIPVDVIAAVELEVENPEMAAVRVRDYWKTTEWASMEALKSTIGANDLRLLLSETEKIASMLKAEIDAAAKDYGVNVRAVRITDVTAPPSLIEELAVIARAERSAKAKRIQAEAEKQVAESLKQASETLSAQEGTMELRQIQALLEMSKEESSMIIIYPVDSFGGQMIASASAGSQTAVQGRKSRPKPASTS